MIEMNDFLINQENIELSDSIDDLYVDDYAVNVIGEEFASNDILNANKDNFYEESEMNKGDLQEEIEINRLQSLLKGFKMYFNL